MPEAQGPEAQGVHSPGGLKSKGFKAKGARSLRGLKAKEPEAQRPKYLSMVQFQHASLLACMLEGCNYIAALKLMGCDSITPFTLI